MLVKSLRSFGELIKLKLSLLVLFSAFVGYYLGSGGRILSVSELIFFLIGGFLVTGAANSVNQILEKDLDAQMDRTKARPIPTGRIGVVPAMVLASLQAVVGVLILLIFVNVASALLSLLSMLLYAFAYTPLKRISPIAVLVGAVPGALPPLIGWVAATGEITLPGMVLFSIQFIWQFPHFWSIAWIMNEDYKKAGFNLLPSAAGKSKKSAFHLFFFSLFLIPMALIPFKVGMIGFLGTAALLFGGFFMAYFAYQLLRTSEDGAARKLMFASFFYLPLIQIFLMVDLI
jgi:heme o synthase